MNIEIDLSGRIEVLNTNTVFAFTDGIKRAILIPARVKRRASQRLEARGVKSKVISIRMFAGGLYLLIKPSLNELNLITIDREFEGWENEIRSLLLSLIRKTRTNFNSDNIRFESVGKQAECHHLALATFRKVKPHDSKVSLSEFLNVC